MLLQPSQHKPKPLDATMTTMAPFLRLISLDLYSEPDEGEIVRRQAGQDGLNDSMFLYTGRHWAPVSRDVHYMTCLRTQAVLLASEEWARLAGSIGTLVDLGTGTGEKLLRFAQSIAGRGRAGRIALILLDIDPDMPKRSRRALAKFDPATVGGLDIVSARANCARLPEVMGDARVRRAVGDADGCAAWLVLGDAFANCGEAQWIDLFRNVMKAGDFLVIGTELGSVADMVNPMEDMLAPYQSPTFKQLFAHPLRHLEGPVSEVEVCELSAPQPRFTALQKTRTIAAQAHTNGGEVITACLNRHDRDELAAYFAGHGFEGVCAAAARDTPFYNYLVFRKI